MRVGIIMAKCKLFTISVTILWFTPFLFAVAFAESSLEIIKHEDAEEGVANRPDAVPSFPDTNQRKHEELPIYPESPSDSHLPPVIETRKSDPIEAIVQEGSQHHVDTHNGGNFLPEEDLDGTIFPDETEVAAEDVKVNLNPVTATAVNEIEEPEHKIPDQSEIPNEIPRNTVTEGMQSVPNLEIIETNEERTNAIDKREQVVEIETETDITEDEPGHVQLENEHESQIVSPDVHNEQTEVYENAVPSFPDTNQRKHEELPIYPESPSDSHLPTVIETRKSDPIEATVQEGSQNHIDAQNGGNFLPEEDFDGTIFPDETEVAAEDVEVNLNPVTATAVNEFEEPGHKGPKESEIPNEIPQNTVTEGMQSVPNLEIIEINEERTNAIDKHEQVVEIETETDITKDEAGHVQLGKEHESQIVSPDVHNEQTEVLEEPEDPKGGISLVEAESVSDTEKPNIDFENEQEINEQESKTGHFEENLNEEGTSVGTEEENEPLATEPELSFDFEIVENELGKENLFRQYYMEFPDHYLQDHEEIILSESPKSVYKIMSDKEEANEEIGEIVFQELRPVDHQSGRTRIPGSLTDSALHEHVDVEELDEEQAHEEIEEHDLYQELDQGPKEEERIELHSESNEENVEEHEEDVRPVAEEEHSEGMSEHNLGHLEQVQVPGTFEEVQAKPVERANETDPRQNPEEHAVCSLPPKSGFCKAYFTRFYFNKKTLECEEFVYGGCGGNANNFLTLQDCMKACATVST